MPRFRDLIPLPTFTESVSLYEADTRQWESVSNNAYSLIPLDEAKQAQARLTSLQSFYSNFLYKRIIDIITDFILSGGFIFDVLPPENNGKALQVINDFWNEPPNRIGYNLRQWIQEWLVTGELLWVFDDNEASGKIYVNTIGSSAILDVVRAKQNYRDVGTLKVSFEDAADPKEFNNLTYSATAKAQTGNAFYFRTGQIGDMLRGIPYLTHSINILNELQAFIFSMLRGAMYRNSVWFDVSMEGKTAAEIDDITKKTGRKPPVPNSVIFHNERVEWNVLNSGGSSSASDINRQVDFFLNVALASSGINRSIFEGNPDRNSTESTNAGFKAIASLQRYLADSFCDILEYILYMSSNKSTIGKRNYKVTCKTSPIGVRDIQRTSGAVARILSALGDAKTNLVLTDDQIQPLIPDILQILKTE
jgi:hypothetical protein